MPPNDPKLSDGGVRRGTCMVGGKAAAEAGAVTHGAVRCSAWLGFGVSFSKATGKSMLASARLALARDSDNSGVANALARDWLGKV